MIREQIRLAGLDQLRREIIVIGRTEVHAGGVLSRPTGINFDHIARNVFSIPFWLRFGVAGAGSFTLFRHLGSEAFWLCFA
jgi:hypothetical protein